MFKTTLSFLEKKNYLLFDETTVSQSENCRLRFNPATKDPTSPVIEKTEPWEGCGPYIWTTKVSASEDGYRMYYVAWENTTNLYRMGIAESKDGLNWVKPRLIPREFNGETMHVGVDFPESPHICWPSTSVTFDPRDTACKDRRYCGLSFTYSGTNAYFSADGYTWHACSENPVWKGTSDSLFCMRDESRNKFVTYYKLWRVRGRTVGETPENIDMLFTTFDEKKLENGVTELKGPRVVHLPNGEEKIIQTSLLLESGNESPDDGGGGHLLGKWNSVRVMCRAESDDFIHWKNPSVVFEADENDRESANIQLISVFEMGG